MKRSELLLAALLVPMDLVMVVLAFLAAYYLRLNSGEVSEGYWPMGQYFQFVISIIPAWIVFFVLAGLYTPKKARRAWEEFANILMVVAGGTMLVVAWPFITRQEFFSRLVVIYLFFFALIFVTIGRMLVRALRQFLYQYGVGVHRVLMVGSNGVAATLIDEIVNNPHLGLRIVGIVNGHDHNLPASKQEDIKYLGSVDDIAKVVAVNPIDDILIADPELSKATTLKLLEFAEDNRINFELSPSLLEVHSANIAVTELAGIPILEYKRTSLDGWGKIIKRFIDIVGSIFGILVFSPIMILVALAVKITSKGPMVYKNERVSDNGRFFAYKFRSMKVDYCVGDEYGGDDALKTEQKLIRKQNTRSGPLYKIKDDPRLTPIGAFIRRTSLDEFPQLFNVLKGEMSLVGPRPHQPREVDQYQRHHRRVLNIKPGLTGLAQISGRSDLDFEDEVRLDTYYIENWSLSLDFRIIAKTPLAVLGSRDRKAA